MKHHEVLVKHREGTCMTFKKTTYSQDLVPTLCGHSVAFPFGFIKSDEPTCEECREKMKESKE